MHRYFAILTLSIFCYACADKNTESDPVFEQPAYKKLTDSIRQSPNNAALYYHRGSMFYHNNQMLHAKQDLRRAWQLAPTEEHALSLVTVLRQEHPDSAIGFIKNAMVALPESIALKVGLARGYQSRQELDAALKITEQVLAAHPHQIDALLLKSELLRQKGDAKGALDALEEAFRYAPADREIGYELAWAWAEAKNPKALKLADWLGKEDSTETAARAEYIKATYFRNIGNPNKALQHYDVAIRLNYNFLDAHLDKAILLYERKQFKDAEVALQLALRVSPSTAEFYYWMGKVQAATGRTTEAKQNYQRAFSLDNSFTEARDAAKSL